MKYGVKAVLANYVRDLMIVNRLGKYYIAISIKYSVEMVN
jgi:hypothetical protein